MNREVISSGTAVMDRVPTPIVRRGNSKKSVPEKDEDARRHIKAVSRTTLRYTNESYDVHIMAIDQQDSDLKIEQNQTLEAESDH